MTEVQASKWEWAKIMSQDSSTLSQVWENPGNESRVVWGILVQYKFWILQQKWRWQTMSKLGFNKSLERCWNVKIESGCLELWAINYMAKIMVQIGNLTHNH
jgi:hypothetical protein